MLSEKEVENLLKRKLRLYVKTNEIKFLHGVDVLQEVLELSNKDIDQMLNKTLEEIKI